MKRSLAYYLFHLLFVFNFSKQIDVSENENDIIYKFLFNSSLLILDDNTFDFLTLNDLNNKFSTIFSELASKCDNKTIIFQIIFDQELNVLANGNYDNIFQNDLTCFQAINFEILGNQTFYPKLVLSETITFANFDNGLISNIEFLLIQSPIDDWNSLYLTFKGGDNWLLKFNDVKIVTSNKYYFEYGSFNENTTNISDSTFAHNFRFTINAPKLEIYHMKVEVVIPNFFFGQLNLLDIHDLNSLNIMNLSVNNSFFINDISLFLFDFADYALITCQIENISIFNTELHENKKSFDIEGVYLGFFTFSRTAYSSHALFFITIQNLEFFFMDLNFSYLFWFKFTSIDLGDHYLQISNVNLKNCSLLNTNFLEILVNCNLNVNQINVTDTVFQSSSLISVNSNTKMNDIYLDSNLFNFTNSENYIISMNLQNQILNSSSIWLINNTFLVIDGTIVLLNINEPQGNLSIININMVFAFAMNLYVFSFQNQITKLSFKNFVFKDLSQSFNKNFLTLNGTSITDFLLEFCEFTNLLFNFPLFLFRNNVNSMNIYINQVKFTSMKVNSAKNVAIFFIDDENAIYNVKISSSYFYDFKFYDFTGTASLFFINSSLSTMIIDSSIFKNISFKGFLQYVFNLDLSSLSLFNSSFTDFLPSLNRIFFPFSIFFLRITNLFVSNCSFENAKYINGSVFYIDTSTKDSIEISLATSNFSRIYSDLGSIFYFNKDEIHSVNSQITSCVFNATIATQSGGAFFLQYINNFEIYESSFINCFSQIGGLIYMWSSKISISGCQIKSDVFDDDLKNYLSLFSPGQLFYLEKSSSYMHNCTFTNFLPLSSTGQVNLIKSDTTELVIDLCLFINNTFLTGSVILLNSNLLIYGTIFQNNSEYITNNNSFLNSYDSFISLVWSTMSCEGCIVSGTICYNCLDGAFLKSEFSFVNFLDSKFLNNHGLNGPVLNAIKESKFLSLTIISISKCLFEDNTAKGNGGSLFFMEISLMLKNNTFTNNSALGLGGAIYFFGAPNLDPNPIIKSCNFSKNSAVIGGAIYYQINYLFLKDSPNIFYKNNASAGFGTNYYSNPRKITFSFAKLKKDYVFSLRNNTILNFRSGGTLISMNAHLISEENERILNNDLLLKPILNIDFPDNTQKYLINLDEGGNFNISTFSIFGFMDTSIILKLTSDSISFPIDPYKNSTPYSVNLTIKFRDCLKAGELYYKTTDHSCFQCLIQTYSYNPDNLACIQCPIGGDCSKTGIFSIVPGFWRKDIYDEGSNILECFNNALNCMGGSGNGNDLCFLGHVGPRCESCDAFGTKWGRIFSKTSGYRCVDCLEVNYSWFFAYFGVICYCILLILNLKESLGNYALIREGGNSPMSITYNLKIERLFSSISKILISYFQIISIVGDFNIFSNYFLEISIIPLASPIKSSLYSFGCLISILFSKTALPLIYYELMLSWLTPLVCAIFGSLSFFLYKYKTEFKTKIRMLLSIILFTFIYFQQELVKQSIQTLTCLEIGAYKYIKADVFYQCDDHNFLYSKLLAIPSLILSSFLIPFLIFLKLYRNKKRLYDDRFKNKYGYIYGDYKKEMPFWEFIRMGERLLIAVIVEYFDSDNKTKGMLALICIFLYLIALKKIQPYEDQKIILLEEISSVICMFSIYLCLLINDGNFTYMTIISYVILFGINVCFFVYMLMYHFHTMKEKIRLTFLSIMKVLDPIKEKIRLTILSIKKVLGCCKKKDPKPEKKNEIKESKKVNMAENENSGDSNEKETKEKNKNNKNEDVSAVENHNKKQNNDKSLKEITFENVCPNEIGIVDPFDPSEEIECEEMKIQLADLKNNMMIKREF